MSSPSNAKMSLRNGVEEDGEREGDGDFGDIRRLKKTMTLDLGAEPMGSGSCGSKRNRNIAGFNGLATGWTPTFGASALLESPDLKMLKFSSPEIERFIINNSSNALTPTPSLASHPVNSIPNAGAGAGVGSAGGAGAGAGATCSANSGPLYVTHPTGSAMFPDEISATEEQKEFGRGFTLALERLINGNQDASDSSSRSRHPSCSSSSTIIEVPQCPGGGHPTRGVTSVSAPVPVTITEMGSSSEADYSLTQLDSRVNGPQGVASNQFHADANGCGGSIKVEPGFSMFGGSPPVSPINMADQEKIKLERKRLRNRIAASKCRRRKLERISKLEDKVSLLKGESSDLTSAVTKLREHVCRLKEELMAHIDNGCQINPRG